MTVTIGSFPMCENGIFPLKLKLLRLRINFKLSKALHIFSTSSVKIFKLNVIKGCCGQYIKLVLYTSIQSIGKAGAFRVVYGIRSPPWNFEKPQPLFHGIKNKKLSPKDGVGLLGRAMVGPAPGGSAGSISSRRVNKKKYLAPIRESDSAQGAVWRWAKPSKVGKRIKNKMPKYWHYAGCVGFLLL